MPVLRTQKPQYKCLTQVIHNQYDSPRLSIYEISLKPIVELHISNKMIWAWFGEL